MKPLIGCAIRGLVQIVQIVQIVGRRGRNGARVPACAILIAATLLMAMGGAGAAEASDPARDKEMRDRYETVLLRNPFQERAFNSVYEGYSKVEGVDKWIEALKPKAESGDQMLPALLLLGQIYDRQFKTTEAMAALEKAAAQGEERPAFKVLLGTLYYKAGKDEKAASLLTAAIEALTDLDQRSAVCRMLGNLYLRQGKRDEAIAVWKRIAEQNSEEIFAQTELAEIYQDNRMWDEAIAVYRRIADGAKDDPYRRCRALRSIGQCLVQAEKFKEAIATYEQGLELVAPGNWLFEDLKIRLVGVYEDIGDLAGLVKYVNARLEQNAGDLEFRDLLAETYSRMAKFPEAEKEYRAILERNPRVSSIHEKLLGLYVRTGQRTNVVATFEKLIELFPSDTDYLRRLGEYHVREGRADQAKEAWRRLVKDNPSAERLSLLAGWFESYEFPDDAIVVYQQAINKSRNKEWVERLASLRHQKGEEAEAVKLWLSVIDPAKSSVDDYSEIASILEANQKNDEALKLRQAAVEKDPQNLELRLAYGKLLLKQQKFDLAVTAFEPLTAQDKNEFLQQQGEVGQIDAWRELGTLDAKQAELERDLRTNPAEAKKLSRLARIYERNGQREKAIALYEKWREQQPDNIEHLRTLVGLYKNSKQSEQAIAACKALLEKDKNRARLYQKDLLDIYLAVDLKDEAIAAAEAIVSLAPSDPEARLTLGQVYQLYRQSEKSFAEYRHALRLEPNEPDYYRQYGEALEQERRYGEAQEAFRKMLDTAKEDTTRLGAVSSLARIHLHQDRLAEIVSEFQRRIRNTPKKLAAYEELAAIYKESGQIARSVEVLEGGLQNVDDKGSALKTLIRMSYEAQDFAKTRSFFEQLLAQSGKPTAQEYERLGQIYAQLGDIEKAKATWNKMVANAPKDAKAHDRLASVLRDGGFTDEALAIKSRAVELDAGDYKRRYEYAQLLAQNEQPVEALKQLSTILEIGDREEQKDALSEKKVERVTKGQQGRTVSPYQFVYGLRGYSSSGYFGGGWQGNFKQFRPQVLMFMANVAQRSIGDEAFIEQLTDRTKKAKANIEAKRDLLAVLQMYNRYEEALKVAGEILEVAPNDVDLLQQTALYYQNEQQYDKAIALMEKLAQTQPKQRVQALQGLVPLYFQNKQQEKAMELADQLLKENPSDMQTIFAMGNFMQNNGKFDQARAIYEKGIDVDPNYRVNIMYSIANIAQRQGKVADATKLYVDLLTDDAYSRNTWMGARRAQNLYVPELAQNRPNYGGLMRNLPQQVFGYIDYQKGQAILYLKQSGQTNNAFEQVEKIARSYTNAVSLAERSRSWETTKLLCAYYLNEKEYAKAGELLTVLRAGGFEEMEWFNAAIYLAQVEDNHERMLKLYDEVLQRFPAKARDVVQAKTITLILGKDYDQAGKLIREMNQQRVPPQRILGLIQQLASAGEKKLARALLEEHLSGVSRNSEALAALARLLAEENEFEQAITLANESWERKSHGRTSQGYFYGPGYYSGSGVTTDSSLGDLHRYYVGAGKSDELIAKFKERLEKQPGSVQAHENLAQLYRLGGKRDEALTIYRQLAEKRPHLMPAKRQIATMYSEMGEVKKATEYYEALLKSNPQAYQEISWDLRYLYQRMGKGKELAQMEDKMAAKARDPNQLQQLANRYQNDGDNEKAAELYQKAIKLSPTSPYLKNQLATILVQLGRLDEAVTLYEEWLDSPQNRAQGNYVDHYTIKQLVGLYRAIGRLPQLKERCEGEVKKNPGDRLARATLIHVAVLEKRFPDAVAGFKALAEGGQDPNGLYEIMNLADITGDTQAALEIIEKSDRQNLYDQQRVARLYMVRGDRKKAEQMLEEYYERQSQYGNGSYYLRQALIQFIEFELWEAAEKFAAKHRSDNFSSSYDAQEFDRAIAERYAKDRRFSSLVDDVMKKNSFKGRDMDLIKAITKELSAGEDGGERRVFLEKLVAGDPKNRDLAWQLAELYKSDPGAGAKRLAILQRLVTEEPNSSTYRTAYTTTLINDGRADEALADLKAWAEAKPGESRYEQLSRQQRAAGRLREARASLEKALALADTSRKNAAQLVLAGFDAEYGDPGARRDALRGAFEAKKDASSFQACLSSLEQSGLTEEAYALFLAHKDAGFLDRYQGDSLFKVCMERGDFQTPLDLNWQFTRYNERYYRQDYLNRTTRLFTERGKGALLATDLQTRLNAETNRNQGMQERLAAAWDTAGYPERALAIYDELIKTSPFNRAAVSGRASLLTDLRRFDDAVTTIRDQRGITDLPTEISAKIQVAGMLFQAKRPAEADKEFAELLTWAKGGNYLEQIGNQLFEQKQYARAAELYEQSMKTTRSWNYDMTLTRLGQCYARLGRAADAVKIWDSRPSSRGSGTGTSMMDWLVAENLHEVTLQYIGMRLDKEKDEPRRHIGLAEAHLGLGRTNEAFAALDRAERDVPPGPKRNDLDRRAGDLLQAKDLAQAALDRCAAGTNRLLTAALVQAMAKVGTSSNTVALIAARIDTLPIEDRDLQLRVAETFQRLNQPQAAVAWYRKVLPSKRESARLSAARGLAMNGAGAEAVPVLSELLKAKPFSVFNDPGLIVAIAKSGDAPLVDRLNQVLADGALHDNQRDYFRAVVTYHRGQTNEARPLIAALTGAPKLSLGDLQTLSSICAEQNLVAERIKFLERLGAGGYTSAEKFRALGELTKIHSKSGNLAGAVATLAEMQGVWGQTIAEEAREALADAVTVDNFAAFKAAILDAVKKAPAHDRASNLIGLAQQLAQRLGQPDTAARLAEAAGLTGLERDEAMAWDALIEEWEIAGPYRLLSRETVYPAEHAMLESENTTKVTVTWRKSDPKQALGVMHLGRMLGLPSGELNNQVAYARTTIKSSEARQVSLHLGSSDWARIWVNGELVHVATESRACTLDQERISIALKPGANVVLIKIANDNLDGWGFCLRLGDADKGLATTR